MIGLWFTFVAWTPLQKKIELTKLLTKIIKLLKLMFSGNIKRRISSRSFIAICTGLNVNHNSFYIFSFCNFHRFSFANKTCTDYLLKIKLSHFWQYISLLTLFIFVPCLQKVFKWVSLHQACLKNIEIK